jgi:flagellin-like protein
MRRDIVSFLRRFRRDQSGIVTILVALAIVVLLGFAAVSVDAGYVVYVQSNLQASANLAALAGGQNIPAGTGSATAGSYSAQTGKLNALSGLTVTTTATLKCLPTLTNNLGLPCIAYSGQPAANAIQVTQTATVPTFFAKVLGFNSTTVTVQAAASAKGGSTPPLNVMIVLDTTASMNNADTSCGSGQTRLSCALNGVQTLLKELQATSAWVGLMVFPGLTSSTVGAEYCAGGTPKTVAYNASPAPVYQIIGTSTSLSTNYNTAGTSGLNTSSTLVKAVGGASTCGGAQAIGGYGTYYPDVITQAQNTLVSVAAARGKQAQNVIIFVSDGDAGTTSGNYPAGDQTLYGATGDCQMAVNAATNATKAGTWVYSIAYGSPTSVAPSGSCVTDKAPMSACLAMQEIASTPSKFFSDTSGSKSGSCASINSISSLNSIFSYVGSDLLNARLVPYNTM